jgi:hypothetical protein
MFSKIKDFLFGKDPVQSPVAAPYKVETVPVEVAPAPVVDAVAVVPEAVVVTPDAVAPNLVVDTIVIEPVPTTAPVAEPKKPRAPAKAKTATKPKPVAAPKKPRAPKAK